MEPSHALGSRRGRRRPAGTGRGALPRAELGVRRDVAVWSPANQTVLAFSAREVEAPFRQLEIELRAGFSRTWGRGRGRVALGIEAGWHTALASLEGRMRLLGPLAAARYWVLKPGMQSGEVVEL